MIGRAFEWLMRAVVAVGMIYFYGNHDWLGGIVCTILLAFWEIPEVFSKKEES